MSELVPESKGHKEHKLTATTLSLYVATTFNSICYQLIPDLRRGRMHSINFQRSDTIFWELLHDCPEKL